MELTKLLFDLPLLRYKLCVITKGPPHNQSINQSVSQSVKECACLSHVRVRDQRFREDELRSVIPCRTQVPPALWPSYFPLCCPSLTVDITTCPHSRSQDMKRKIENE